MYIGSNVIHNLCYIRGVLCLDRIYEGVHYVRTSCILQLFGLGTKAGNVIHSFYGTQVIMVKQTIFTCKYTNTIVTKIHWYLQNVCLSVVRCVNIVLRRHCSKKRLVWDRRFQQCWPFLLLCYPTFMKTETMLL